MFRTRVLLVAALLISTSSFAQTIGYERILIPVVIPTEVPGAFGSLWTSHLTVHNDSDRVVAINTNPTGICGTCPVGPALPHRVTTLKPTGYRPATGGMFLYVEMPGSERVAFASRIQDIARQSLTWGTEIPLIREADTFPGKLQLLNVPTESRFRQGLRVYDFDGRNSSVGLKIFSVDSDIPVVDTEIALSEGTNQDVPYPQLPGYAQISFLTEAYPQLLSVPLLRVEVRRERQVSASGPL